MAASVTAIAYQPAADPLDAGVSYCLAMPVENRSLHRKFKIRKIRWLLVGFAALMIAVVSGVMAAPAVFPEYEHMLLPVMIICLVVWFGGMLMSIIGHKRFLRQHLGRRYARLRAVPTPWMPIVVNINDSATHHQLRVADDMALAVFDLTSRRLIIEGLTHRYLIRAGDVQNVREVCVGHNGKRSTWGMEIVYRCGTLPLTILVIDKNMESLARQINLTLSAEERMAV